MPRYGAVPAYLLDRNGAVHDRELPSRVICISGNARNEVPAAELESWIERMAGSLIVLEVLSSTSDPHFCTPNPDERARIDAYLAQEATKFEEAEAEREDARKEKAELDQCIEFEARRGCGLRACWPGVRSQFRLGDIVYHPPPPDRATQPGVAVVLEVQRDCGGCGYGGGGRVPTGELQLLWWDIKRLTFTRSQHIDAQQASGFTLMPPCCGQGASCQHWHSTDHPQWPIRG